MVNIWLGTRIDPLIGGACDRIYEPIEEDRARAILAFNKFEEDKDNNRWVKVENSKILYYARIRKAQEFSLLLGFPGG